MKFQDKVVIITGASIGIGKATAQQFAREGAHVVLVDLNEEGLNTVKAELLPLGHEVITYACDVSDEQAVNRIVKETLARFGRIDILVNNAGIWRRFAPFVETTSDMWKRYIDVNLMSVLYFSHAVLPSMLEKGYGRIISVASVAGVYGNANMVDYSLTKGAIISFTKALAKEVSAKGITINSISPGSVSNVQDVIEPSELSFSGRTGTHTENANVICFLASDEAAYISGQNILVDGCRKKM